MVRISWPAAVQIQGTKDPVSAQAILLEIVMSRDYWRQSYEMICAGDSICDALERGGDSCLITQDQHEKLIAGCKLDGQAIQPPSVNRFYFKILRAIHVAKSEE